MLVHTPDDETEARPVSRPARSGVGNLTGVSDVVGKVHAIPTTYAGVRFRSRLEARWAAFFDLLGWSWEYEPIDLNGYIPDFILMFKRPVLVEIKPILPGLENARRLKMYRYREQWPNGGVVLGATISTGWQGPSGSVGYVVGPGLEILPADGSQPSGWPLGFVWCRDCQTHSIATMYNAGEEQEDVWCCDRPAGSWMSPDQELALRMRWHEAGNRVQWKRPA